MAATGDNGSAGRSIFDRVEQRPRYASLLDLDPDLLADAGEESLARARDAAPTACVVELEEGRLESPPVPQGEGTIGLLVLDGLVFKSAFLGEEVVTEVIGPGDLIRPGETSAERDALLPCGVGWTVAERARVAVLGRRVALVAARIPELVPALIDRTARRARSQAIFVAIAHTKRIDPRILILLWHLAERWGRVTPQGVLVPIGLTHRRLGELVGAQRPSVTAAMSRLASRGLVLRTPGRGFLLTPRARSEIGMLCETGEAAREERSAAYA